MSLSPPAVTLCRIFVNLNHLFLSTLLKTDRWALDLNVTRKMYPRDSKYTYFATFLQQQPDCKSFQTLWRALRFSRQQEIRLVPYFLILVSSSSPSFLPLPTIEKHFSYFYILWYKMTFWRFPQLDRTGKEYWSSTFPFSFASIKCKIWGPAELRSVSASTMFWLKSSSLDTAASPVKLYAFSFCLWLIMFLYDFTLIVRRFSTTIFSLNGVSFAPHWDEEL